jgi:hypothetical protein
VNVASSLSSAVFSSLCAIICVSFGRLRLWHWLISSNTLLSKNWNVVTLIAEKNLGTMASKTLRTTARSTLLKRKVKNSNVNPTMFQEYFQLHKFLSTKCTILFFPFQLTSIRLLVRKTKVCHLHFMCDHITIPYRDSSIGFWIFSNSD